MADISVAEIFTKITNGNLTADEIRAALEKKKLVEVNEEIHFVFI